MEATNELRETLENAFDASEQEGRPPADPAQPVRVATETPADSKTTATTETRDVARRPDGKYAAAVPAVAADSSAAAARPTAPVVAEQKPDQFAKAPASWKAGAREGWAHLPADVRAEVHRRERETATTLQQSSQARDFMQTVAHMQQEFAPSLQAEGVDIMTATRNLMQVSSRLRFGTPQEKAVTVAQIMQAYGVDVPTLDSILSNQPMPQQAQQQAQQLRDPRLDGLLSQIAQARQSAAQQVEQAAVSEIQAFGTNKDFFDDVREVMADLIEVSAKRGVDLSLAQAYERACQLDPEISRVLAQRQAAGAAQNQQRSTARNRAAASSVRSTPVASGVAASPENLRGTLEAAWDAAAG